MSRNFLIESDGAQKLMLSTTPHEQMTAVERAMREGHVTDSNGKLVKSWHFDLLGTIKNLKVQRLKDDVLNRLKFSVDGYISGQLSRMVTAFYKNTVGVQYSDFLNSLHLGSDAEDTLREHIQAFQLGEVSLREAGMDVTPAIPRLNRLWELRDQLHGLSAMQMLDPSRYYEPTKREDKVGFKPGRGTEEEFLEFVGSPRLRSLTVQAEEELRGVAADDTNDAELRDELFEQYKLANKYERLNQLRMDQMKASSLIALWAALQEPQGDVELTTSDENGNAIVIEVPAEDAFVEIAPRLDDESDPFNSLDAKTQNGLLNTALRAVVDSRLKVVVDSRIPVMDKATLRVEAKALIPQLQSAIDELAYVDVAS